MRKIMLIISLLILAVFISGCGKELERETPDLKVCMQSCLAEKGNTEETCLKWCRSQQEKPGIEGDKPALGEGEKLPPREGEKPPMPPKEGELPPKDEQATSDSEAVEDVLGGDEDVDLGDVI